MTLDAHNIAHYLLGCGLITRDSVVDGDFVVIEMLRRNRNFRIQRIRAPGLFVKQVRVRTPDMVVTLEREARCYELACSETDFADLRPLMPKFVRYDVRNHILILELLPANQSLREYQMGPGRLNATIGEQLGAALSVCHTRIAVPQEIPHKLKVFPRRAPWILSFPSLNFERGSPGGAIAQLHSLLRRYPDLAERLDGLREGWRIECLIHGDLRWDNWLVLIENGDARNVKIVDWELADLGDAGWDLGDVFHGFLCSWVSSMADSGREPGSMLMEGAGRSLEDMQPSINSFWQTYTLKRQLGREQARELLDRSIRYCAARMVQTVFEISVERSQLPPFGIRLLQLADNILANPEDGVRELLDVSQ